MTSFGCNEVTLPGRDPTFRAQGQVCHLIGSLSPAPKETVEFLQFYFIDGEMTRLKTKMSITGLRPKVPVSEQNSRYSHGKRNVCTREIKTVMEVARQNHTDNFSIVIHENLRPLGEHERKFYAPETNEVVILIPTEPIDQWDIILQSRDDSLEQICELHPAYDALQCPLLLPSGTHGWSL